MSGANRRYVGFYRGTGALQAIDEAGFRPRLVKVTSLADGATCELADGEGAVAADVGGLADLPADLDWQTGLTVTTDAVTMSRPGPVLAAEATTATSAGPKQMQTGAPAAGEVQVTYDAAGVATLTFNGTDAVTEAAVKLGASKSFLTATAGLQITATGFTVGTGASVNGSGVAFRFECMD